MLPPVAEPLVRRLVDLTPEMREHLTPQEREEWQLVFLREWLAVRCPERRPE